MNMQSSYINMLFNVHFCVLSILISKDLYIMLSELESLFSNFEPESAQIN